MSGAPAAAAASTTSATATPVLLRHVLPALSGALADLLAAPRGLDRAVAGVVIAEPDAEPEPGHRDCLVLLIGARGGAALRALIAAARSGAAAVAVRTGEDPEAVEALRQAATESGTALLGVRDGARWEQVDAVARTVVDSVRRAPDLGRGSAHGDLYSLVQTLAALTGGAVSVEDPACRVLAYSRSDEQVDDVRRLSILGQACPAQYLEVLDEAGVYERLRSEEVVEVAPRPDLATRRRLAVGITAGGRLLGTIWVQETGTPLTEETAQALRGAARLAALLLIRGPGGTVPEGDPREELAAALLAGRSQPASLAGHLGIAVRTGATVIAVDTCEPAGDGGPEAELRRVRTADMVALHAVAHRRTAVTARLDGRLYVLVPDTAAESAADTSAPLAAWAADLVATLRRHLGTPVRAAVSAPVARLADVPAARAEADRVLAVVARDPARAVATYRDARASVVLDLILEVLHGHPDIRDPALEPLLAHDRKHGSQLCASLLGYLDAFGDVRAVAERMHVHPNTLRYRVRRAVALTGIDLDDPEQRLITALELRRARTSNSPQ
ncbi:helix-turn-helix domain-containing protein [Streptomyces sp. CRN 30]|uniref:PucR family transcriptional regulator n=1 Tax=Streptomyces sp. CRN 30 TaxID=3075613 RepID=UPI002A7ECF09|nr:helix-turn-helix domain-containing protein [Streptomyces sp. CRN 30]